MAKVLFLKQNVFVMKEVICSKKLLSLVFAMYSDIFTCLEKLITEVKSWRFSSIFSKNTSFIFHKFDYFLDMFSFSQKENKS